MLVGGGRAIEVVGSLLQKLAEVKGQEAAQEAWQATGAQIAAFVPKPDRENEAAVKAMADKYGLLPIAC